MNGNDQNGIQCAPMDDIVGFEDTGETLTSDVDDPALRLNRARTFRDWLIKALPETLKEYICFVDYTMFQDPRVSYPYFYLVSPTDSTRENYRQCVENLVEGSGDKQDCFSVAYHPEFVGITAPKNSNFHWIISLGDEADSSPVAETDSRLDEKSWIHSFYPIWPKTDTIWPPNTIEDLIRVCGRHSLEDCLKRFRNLLRESRHLIVDSLGRPVNLVLCIPFLVANRSSARFKSNLPFSEIAGALFLGLSFKEQEENIDLAMEFVRTIALRTYRAAGTSNAVATGLDSGMKRAIETFAHQIKSVANAINKTWLMGFDKWEQVRLDYPDKTDRIEAARILPVPQLFQSIRDTLVLWSQTRRLTDLYPTWPTSLSEIVYRAWDFASGAHFTFANKNRNFEEDVSEIIKVWEQKLLMVKIKVEGSDAPAGKFPTQGLVAEKWICDVTRLLTAIFDNSLEHGVRDIAPRVLIDWRGTKEISITISNEIERPIEAMDSRLRVGMKGEDVLRYLESQLNAKLDLPKPPYESGDTYGVSATIPLPKHEEWS